jgi:hypothetical protein
MGFGLHFGRFFPQKHLITLPLLLILSLSISCSSSSSMYLLSGLVNNKKVHKYQGDQSSRIFAQWVGVYFVQFF